MTKSIQHTLFFPHAPEVVWEYLTNSELLAQWLMPNDFMPITGYDFAFKTKPLPQFNSDGIFHCKVLEITPFKRLSYSWKVGPGNGQVNLDSIVVWTLHTKGDGTELVLEHSGFNAVENAAIYAAMYDGWLKNMQKIPALINAKHGTTAA